MSDIICYVLSLILLFGKNDIYSFVFLFQSYFQQGFGEVAGGEVDTAFQLSLGQINTITTQDF